MQRKLQLICKAILITCITMGSLIGCNKTPTVKPVSSESKEEATKNFLNSNYSNLNIMDDKDYSSFRLLNTDLKNDVFLMGNLIGTKTSEDLGFKFLKYFKENAGVRYYIQEAPYSLTARLNEYLSSGDERILNDIFKLVKGTMMWNKSEYDKWKKIYEYNKSLPKNEQIIVIGIDAEYDSGGAIKFMHSLIPESTAPNKIEPIIKELNNLYVNPNTMEKAKKDFCTNLKQSITENRDIYNGYFGDKLFDLELVNDNILAGFDFSSAYSKSANEYNTVRSKNMYENFKKIYARVQNTGKFYWEFQSNPAYIFQKSHKGVDYLGSLINSESSPVKGKVLSIMSIYKNCDSMYQGQNGKYSRTTVTNYAAFDNPLDSFIETDNTLFKLNGDNSPFEKDLIWPDNYFDPGTRQGNEVTTDYYQYIVVIKNSKATEPLE